MAAGSKRVDGEADDAARAAASERAGLREQIQRTAERALQTGALEPIRTQARSLEHEGVRFSLRIALAALRPRSARTGDAPVNPFLPYERELFVADLGDDHVCLLNKYMVLDDHALIVTRAFEPQASALGQGDFRALGDCLEEVDGLGFYNSRPEAGASQPHRHLQLVPTPIGDGPGRAPIEALLDVAALGAHPARVTQRSALPFRHGLVRVDDCTRQPSAARGAALEERYRALQQATRWPAHEAYNLLVTREWMLLVPRRCESSHGVEINSLGLAGALFARDDSQLARIEEVGPMQLLRDVTFRAE